MINAGKRTSLGLLLIVTTLMIYMGLNAYLQRSNTTPSHFPHPIPKRTWNESALKSPSNGLVNEQQLSTYSTQ